MFILQMLTDVWDGLKRKIKVLLDSRNELRQEVGHASLSLM